MQTATKGKLTRSQLMEEIIGMRKNTDKKPAVKFSNQLPVEKQTLNKTTIPGSLPVQVQENQQLKTITTMAISRKKQNFSQLKKWDAQRSQQLQLHINAIENLHNQVDKFIKISIDNLEIYITFFKERAKCEEKLASSPIIDVRKSIEHNGLTKTSYTNCTLLLNLVYDNSTEEGQRSQLFANTIRKVILKERLDEHSSQSHLNLLRIRQRIATLRSQLTQCNKQAQKRSSLLVESYTLNEGFVADKDFYELQLSFIEQAAQQTNIQKRLGQLCLDYLKLAINQEQRRKNILKQCLSIYIDALKYAYPIQQSILPQVKDSSVQGINQLLCLDRLVDGRVLNLIKLKMNVPEVNMINFEKYLMNFAFQQFSGKLLLLKEYNVFHQTGKNKYQPCYMVVTVDRFLHLFLNPSGLYSKPSVSLRVDSTLLIKSASDIKIQLKKKEVRKKSVISYIIWDTKTQPTFTIQFNKKDSKEQFCVFLKKLI